MTPVDSDRRRVRTDRYADLVDTMHDIVATDGLERLSVREVATRAGVSIGAVQHHFRTKDEMLTAAFEDVVARTRARIEGLTLGPDLRANLLAVLEQLLPLDERRAAETRVHLAFAAQAAVTPALARIQGRTLAGVTTELAAAITAAGSASPGRPQRTATETARILLAVTDGIALHAVSAPDLLRPRALRRVLAATLDALFVPSHDRRTS